jgi:hypothetical protein
MGNICKYFTQAQDTDFNRYNNNTINNNRKKIIDSNTIPALDISNNVIALIDDEEPPSYREVRNEEANFYKKTMLFNGFSGNMNPRAKL